MYRIALIICILAFAAYGQRQSVIVLPSIADSRTNLKPEELEFLTEKIRSIATNALPLKDFNLLKQDVVRERLGDEALFVACKDGTCVGELVARAQADFGARVDILSVNEQMYLKFELYGTLRGERESGTISQFNEPVQDFADMQAIIDRSVPEAFKRIILVAPSAPPLVQLPQSPPPTPEPPPPILDEPEKIELAHEEIKQQTFEQPESSSSFWVALTLDVVGAGLLIYGFAMEAEAVSRYDEYRSLPASAPSSQFRSSWSRAEDAKKARNIGYALGSIFLAAGIGVHIWF